MLVGKFGSELSVGLSLKDASGLPPLSKEDSGLPLISKKVRAIADPFVDGDWRTKKVPIDGITC